MLVTRPSRTRLRSTAAALALAALSACGDRPLVVGEWVISRRGGDGGAVSADVAKPVDNLPPDAGDPPPMVDLCVPAAGMPYREVTLPAAELARRVAWYLWRTPADDDLTARLAGVTDTPRLRAAVKPMLLDNRMLGGAKALARSWLKSDAVLQVTERPEIAGQLTPELRRNMADEPGAAIWAMLLTPPSSSSRLASLLTNPTLSPISQGLSEIYNPPGPTSNFVPNALPGRSGILTLPAFLAANPRAPQRAQWLLNSFMCSEVPVSPPPSVIDQAVTVKPGQSYRDAFNATSQPVCQGCHAFLDSGWALEHFDLLGRYRTTDNGVAIDSSTRVHWLGGASIEVQDARELGQKLAADCGVRTCVARSFLAHALDKPSHEVTDEQVLDLARAFTYADADLPTLLLDVVESEAFLAP